MSLVFDAACSGQVHHLASALKSHRHLIDVANPDNYTNPTLPTGATPNQSSWTPLFGAAFYGHAEAIDLLVRAGSKALDTPTKSGQTPLFAAAKEGHVHAIEALLRAGSKALDVPNLRGETPLFIAAQFGHAAVIDKLVEAGSAAVNKPNKDGVTPLMIAVLYDHVDAVATLLRLGADPHASFKGRTVRSRANNADIRALFDALGPEPVAEPSSSSSSSDPRGDAAVTAVATTGSFNPVLYDAAATGKLAEVCRLLDVHPQLRDAANRNMAGRTPLCTAAAHGHAAVIEALLRAGSTALDQPTDLGQTPLLLAARAGHADAVRTLLRMGAVRNATWKGRSAREWAKNADIRALFETVAVDRRFDAVVYDAVVSPDDATARTNATTTTDDDDDNGEDGRLGRLLRSHVQLIDAVNPNNSWTPMFGAVFYGNRGAVAALLRAGSMAVDTADDDGWTPVYAAAYRGHAALVEMLVHAGSRAVDTPDKHGYTPLLRAVQRGHAEAARTLLRLGANADAACPTSGKRACDLAATPELRGLFAHDSNDDEYAGGGGAAASSARPSQGQLFDVRNAHGCQLAARPADFAALLQLLTDGADDSSAVAHLSLNRRQLGDERVAQLCAAIAGGAALTTLRSLDVNHNNIGSGGAGPLGALVQQPQLALTTLSLSHNRLGVAGGLQLAAALGGNTSLTVLAVNSNSLEDASVCALAATLAAHPSLTSLSLAENWVTDEGARALGGMLAAPQCRLSYLDVSANWIETAGGEALLAALTQGGNATLHTVDLSSNWISSKRTAEIAMAFASSNRPASAAKSQPREQAAELGQRSFDAVVRLIDGVRAAGGLREEGIFRVPGNATLCRLTADQLMGPTPDAADLSILELQDLASTLKLLLRELEPPLVPYAVYHSLIAALAKREAAPDSPPGPYYQPLLAAMPARNHQLLRIVVAFLRAVAGHESHTRMNARNLALILGPTILRSDASAAAFRDAFAQTKLLAEFIHAADLLPDP